MFLVRLNDLFRVYCILLMVLVWIIILCLLYSMYKEEKIEEDKKYDIDHKLIKDIKVRKEDKK